MLPPVFDVCIPARSDSQRLPRKLYQDVNGMSVIERTWRQATQSLALAVTVIRKDEEMRDFCESFGANTSLTDGTERNGTEAIAQFVEHLPDTAIIVNVQGDDCMIPPLAISACGATELLEDYDMSTLIAPLDENKNGVSVCKVDVNHRDEAIYFSRADIPRSKNGTEVLRYTHLGIYGYRVGLLKKYLTWGPSYSEYVEGLEQLRPLYYGVPIICARWTAPYHKGVDTQEDLERVRLLTS